MKKLLTIIFILVSFTTLSQPIVNRAGPANTVRDARLAAQYNFYVPIYVDTSSANLQIGLDLAGALIWSTSDSSLYARQKSVFGTFWLKVGGASSGPGGNSWLVGGNIFPVTTPTRDIGTTGVYGGAVGLMTNGVVRSIIPHAGYTLSNDTTSNKIFTLNPTTKEWGYANWNNGGGATLTWQQTLAAGSTLNQYNSIDVDGNDLDFGDFNQIWYWSRPNNQLTDIYQIMNGDIITSTIRNLARTKSAEVTVDSTGDYGMGVLIQSATGTGSSILEVGESKVTLKLNSNPFRITRPAIDTPFTVSTSGNIGINQPSPSTKLHVNGAAGFRYVDGFEGVGKVLQDDGSGTGVAKWTTPSTVATSVPISGLTAATGTNSINNVDYSQTWQWNSLSGAALNLSTSSTAASGSSQKMLNILMTGTNASSSITSYGIFATNNHAGTSSTNIGIATSANTGTNNYGLYSSLTGAGSTLNVAGYFSATNSTNNYAIIVPSGGGSVGIGTSTPTALLHVVPVQTSGIGVAVASSTTTSGSIMDITGTSTALASGNEGLNISVSGANGTNAITATGARISVTNTNGTSGTNVGIDVTASGATTDNISINATGRNILSYNNTDYTNTSGAGSVLHLKNPNATGQTVVYSEINGSMMAKWRTDYTGNISWVSAKNANDGGHYFFVGGDYGTGKAQMYITNAGTRMGNNLTVNQAVSHELEVLGNTYTSGTVQFANFGAGTATFDASGNISSVSDSRLKNVSSKYTAGIRELKKINPIVYKWNEKSGMEMQHSYIGFSAQNIQSALGDNAIGINKDGYLSIQDRAIMAVLVNVVKEQQKQIDELTKEIKKLKRK